MNKISYVYILANHPHGALYVGVTNNLKKRVSEHKNYRSRIRFTRRHRITQLVYYEKHESIRSALAREKQLKWWKRSWKINLIEQHNPEWIDLSQEWL